MIESCFQPQGELLLADLLVCPSRDAGACGPGGCPYQKLHLASRINEKETTRLAAGHAAR
jgi:hypothetical protein